MSVVPGRSGSMFRRSGGDSGSSCADPGLMFGRPGSDSRSTHGCPPSALVCRILERAPQTPRARHSRCFGAGSANRYHSRSCRRDVAGEPGVETQPHPAPVPALARAYTGQALGSPRGSAPGGGGGAPLAGRPVERGARRRSKSCGSHQDRGRTMCRAALPMDQAPAEAVAVEDTGFTSSIRHEPLVGAIAGGPLGRTIHNIGQAWNSTRLGKHLVQQRPTLAR